MGGCGSRDARDKSHKPSAYEGEVAALTRHWEEQFGHVKSYEDPEQDTPAIIFEELQEERHRQFLVNDVLIFIFTSLPVADRLNVRLVCRSWAHQVCCQQAIV